MTEQDAVQMMKRPGLSYDEIFDILYSFLKENGFDNLAEAMLEEGPK